VVFRNFTATSLFRWFVVGCMSVALDTCLFLLLYSLTKNPTTSNIISMTLATTFNYLSHYKWSFESNRNHAQSTIIYLISFFTFLSLGTFLVRTFISIGFLPIFAKLGSAAIISPLSFLVMKFFTFKKVVSE
jgi:putative flippase GtrA